MSGQGLPEGAFLTTIEGRRCTARPKPRASETIEAATTTTPAFSAATTAGVVAEAGDNSAGTTLVEVTSISSSTSTTSSLLVTTTNPPTSVPITNLAQAGPVGDDEVEAPALPPPVALASTPSPLPPPPPPPELPPTASSTTATIIIPTPSPVTSQQTVETSIAQTSQADTNLIASPADSLVSSQATAVSEVSSSSAPALNSGDGAAAAGIFTTIGTALASTNNAASEATGTTNSAVSPAPTPNSNTVQSTVAVAGGVIGGVVAISLVAFVIWWWRRRVLRKRRSTLLTPLDAVPSFDRRDEKGPYVINRGSIGPTPMTVKLKAALGYNVKKFRGRMSHMVTKSNGGSPPVSLDQGTRSRANSSGALMGGGDVTSKDRFLGWWSRLAGGASFNWRLRGRKDPNLGDFAIVSEKNTTATATRNMGSQPDFLTLLGMDDGELDREAQRRRASISRKNGGSAGSSDNNFLGTLNLNFASNSDDPFSDANALAHASAQPAPLVVSQSNNPFSDANAIRDMGLPKPSTYVADIRRSRGQSVSDNNIPNNRDSAGSVGSFAARRNKFRSDPFDLERPELLAGARAAKNTGSMSNSSTAGTAGSDVAGRNSTRTTTTTTADGGVGVRRPPGAHTRADSFTSKYSSGISMGDWSDPGPDVGPAATGRGGGWDGRPEPRESPTQGWRDRLEREAAAAAAAGKNGAGGKRRSNGSERQVGKAM